MKKLVIALIIIFSFLIAVVKNDIKLNPESQSRDSRDLLGDINQDGTVNLSDVLQIVGMIMGLIVTTIFWKCHLLLQHSPINTHLEWIIMDCPMAMNV